MITVIIKLLETTQPQFIGENNTQLLRKLLLEMLLRVPYNDVMRERSKRLMQVCGADYACCVAVCGVH